ncbi:MAG TPA: hypothetical protein V6C71_07140 [Coleofasciculaceae cyanobacterium]
MNLTLIDLNAVGWIIRQRAIATGIPIRVRREGRDVASPKG